MHTFEIKTFDIHVSSDGSGQARLDLGVTFEPGVHEVPTEELVQFARWLLKRTGPQTIDVPGDLLERYKAATETFGGTVQQHAMAALEGGAAALELGKAGVEALSEGRSGGLLEAMAKGLLRDASHDVTDCACNGGNSPCPAKQLQDGRPCEHATWCVTCCGWTNGKPQERGA